MHEDKDSTNNQYKKVTYHLQEMAFQKYPFEINNKTFVINSLILVLPIIIFLG